MHPSLVTVASVTLDICARHAKPYILALCLVDAGRLKRQSIVVARRAVAMGQDEGPREGSVADRDCEGRSCGECCYMSVNASQRPAPHQQLTSMKPHILGDTRKLILCHL
jgi:hypothetical protein